MNAASLLLILALLAAFATAFVKLMREKDANATLRAHMALSRNRTIDFFIYHVKMRINAVKYLVETESSPSAPRHVDTVVVRHAAGREFVIAAQISWENGLIVRCSTKFYICDEKGYGFNPAVDLIDLADTIIGFVGGHEELKTYEKAKR